MSETAMYIDVVSLHTYIIGALDFNLLSLCPNIRIRTLNLANSICDIEQFALVSGKESG